MAGTDRAKPGSAISTVMTDVNRLQIRLTSRRMQRLRLDR